jgi:hypothetical protein
MPIRSKSGTEGLLRRNALACESAKWPQCTCHCKGALHGQKHSEEWLEKATEEAYERQFKYLVKEDAERLRREVE